MPVYEFEISNRETGETLLTVAVPIPLQYRDSIEIRRRAIPSNVRVCSIEGTHRDPMKQSNQVLRACQRAEVRQGNTSKFQRNLGYSAETIKKIWQNEHS